MVKVAQPWELSEPGPTWANELARKIQRRWRRVPDFQNLRARGMTIGRDVSAANGVWLDPGYPWLLSIGDNVGFSLDVIVLTHDASPRRVTGYAKIGPVSIGSRVFIGARAMILPGVSIGDDVVIAAGAVVAHDVASNTVVAGVPAKKVAVTREWAEQHSRAADAGPTWDRDEVPVYFKASLDQQRSMKRALSVNRVGYIKQSGSPSPPQLNPDPVQ